MTSYAILHTKILGNLLLVADAERLHGVYFADCKHAPSIEPTWTRDPKQKILAEATRQLEVYLTGGQSDFSVPLHFDGTAFQKEVWRQIARIPFGTTITYTELAKRAGKPDAIRAVGTATGRNPLSLVIPCHRIVGKHGSLGGYAGTLERKQRLLELEKAE